MRETIVSNQVDLESRRLEASFSTRYTVYWKRLSLQGLQSTSLQSTVYDTVSVKSLKSLKSIKSLKSFGKLLFEVIGNSTSKHLVSKGSLEVTLHTKIRTSPAQI